MQIEFIPADHVELDEVVTIFNAGYEGYIMPVNVNADWMSGNLSQNDTQLALSRIALVDGEAAGICLLAKRSTHGWINAVGVAPPFRRQGIARALMTTIFDVARENGITQVNLECIVGNDGALALYQSLGFTITRKLLILTREPDLTALPPAPHDFVIQPAEFEDVIGYYDAFHPQPNPWQRSKESLITSASNTQQWVARKNDTVHAYLIARVIGENIIITDAAYDTNADDALLTLLIHLHQTYPEHTTRVVNLPQNDPTLPLFDRLGYKETMAQHEMTMSSVK
ncbi:MAG: GNAT family N-acetyltransferase [Aggregatilineales bacterium]